MLTDEERLALKAFLVGIALGFAVNAIIVAVFFR